MAGYRGKRALDLLLVLLALPLLAPLLTLLSVVTWLAHGRPLLYRQRRPGLNCRPFVLLKLRTMTQARDLRGYLLPDADRLTQFGRFLRSTSMDELPELINVLRGEMSLVGPRPLLMQYLDRYTPEQLRRHKVLPGITGWAQINGRNGLSWEKKFELDLWYVEHQSLWLDVTIIALTGWKVLRREGISHAGEATMPEYTGPSAQERRPSAPKG